MAGILSERHAKRRAQKARIKARAFRRACMNYSASHYMSHERRAEYIAKDVQYYETPHRCANRCCRNERQWEGMTVQERRQIEVERSPSVGRKRRGPYELWSKHERWQKKWWRQRRYATLELAQRNLEAQQRKYGSVSVTYEIRVRQ